MPKQDVNRKQAYLALLRSVAGVTVLGPKLLRATDKAAQDVRWDRLSRVADAERDYVSAVGVGLEVGVSALSDAREQVARL